MPITALTLDHYHKYHKQHAADPAGAGPPGGRSVRPGASASPPVPAYLRRGRRRASPIALAVDPVGRVGVLDPKAGVVIFALAGEAEAFVFSAAGVEQPVGIGLGGDGALHLFDQEGGGWFTER